MSATIHFNAIVPAGDPTVYGYAYLNDTADALVREFVEELELADNGYYFNDDGVKYDNIAEFVEAYPEYFDFYDTDDNLKNEEWEDLEIVSFW